MQDHMAQYFSATENNKKICFAYLAFRMQEELSVLDETSGIVFSEPQIVAWLSEILARHQVENRANTAIEFFDWAVAHSGLLVPLGEKVYGFADVNIQAYLCAYYLKTCFTSLYYRQHAKPEYEEFDNVTLNSYANDSLWDDAFIYLLELLSAESDSHALENVQAMLCSYHEKWCIKILSNKNINKPIGIIKSLVHQAKNLCVESNENERDFELENYGIFLNVNEGLLSELALNPSVVQLLKVSPLNNFDLLGQFYNLTHLVCECPNLTSLEALAACENIEYIDLANTGVADLSPLTKCQNIQVLYLYNTPATDLSPLATLEKLRFLCLNKDKNLNLSPLKHLKNLRVYER